MLLSLNNASLRIFWTTTHRLIRDYELTIVMKLTLNGGLSLYVALGWTRIYHVGHSMTTTVDKLFPLVVAGSSPPRLCWHSRKNGLNQFYLATCDCVYSKNYVVFFSKSKHGFFHTWPLMRYVSEVWKKKFISWNIFMSPKWYVTWWVTHN